MEAVDKSATGSVNLSVQDMAISRDASPAWPELVAGYRVR
jgi:hypothetical protein